MALPGRPAAGAEGAVTGTVAGTVLGAFVVIYATEKGSRLRNVCFKMFPCIGGSLALATLQQAAPCP